MVPYQHREVSSLEFRSNTDQMCVFLFLYLLYIYYYFSTTSFFPRFRVSLLWALLCTIACFIHLYRLAQTTKFKIFFSLPLPWPIQYLNHPHACSAIFCSFWAMDFFKHFWQKIHPSFKNLKIKSVSSFSIFFVTLSIRIVFSSIKLSASSHFCKFFIESELLKFKRVRLEFSTQNKKSKKTIP